MSQERPSIFYLDFLRCIAALAVIAIHVLGPFRYLYGEIPDSEWLAATGINSLTRWAVPVFMMISGALLLSSERAFNCEHYLTKRLSKVAVPFVGWTLIYAVIGGFTGGGWSSTAVMQILNDSPNEPVWYHLWFFYDFIPLYFVIPFLIPVLKKASPELVKLAVMSWMVMFLMNWLKVESFLLENLVLYTGYLVLGWYLFNRDNSKELKYWLIGGGCMLVFNFFGSWQMAVESGEYSSFFMGYKTLNTVIIGAMLFVTAQTYADKISGKLRALVLVISKYSLGIYLLHPILLIPVRNLDNGVYSLFGTNWLAIPVITIIIMLISLLCTMFLVKIPFIKRLVP
ncbi:acyltransferase [Psychromonas aquimarina]|uniref:acyltransferase n=1 Tax=Psychromonas aquimarina TaxID=444919 RepID=UPI00040BA68F|nr:acyltransferase family protein [Psychromonas aquimarina]